jgi:hypothetical protein
MILVVAALLGVWGLSATRAGFLRAGHYRGSTRLQYEAEEGLQKAALRIQEISERNSALYSGSEPTIDFLVNGLPTEKSLADLSVPVPDCPESFDPRADRDQPVVISGVNTNVVCNFMGTALDNTQVILVRKDDFTDGTKKAAVFLLNSIARDPAGRKRITQGVAVLPYEGDVTPFRLVPGSRASLVTTLKGIAD